MAGFDDNSYTDEDLKFSISKAVETYSEHYLTDIERIKEGIYKVCKEWLDSREKDDGK